MEQLWGIDLGGTKIEGVVLKSKDDPEVLIRERIPTESSKGYDHILNRIEKILSILSQKVGERPGRIGMGTPGSIDPDTGFLKNSNSTALNNRPFLADIQTKLGLPVRIANDANCFTLAECKLGAVKQEFPDANVAFGVIMGTGVGGGVVINGEILNGHQNIAGEWGHNFLDASGGPCYCGKSGCVETVISGPALEKYYQRISGIRKTLAQIYQDHLAGNDDHAVETMNRLITYFGKSLSNVVNILDPDVIVVGGGVGNIDLLYSRGVEAIGKYVFNPTFKTQVVKPKLGDSAGVFGAAFLVA